MSDGIREVHFVRENEVVNVLNLIERGRMGVRFSEEEDNADDLCDVVNPKRIWKSCLVFLLKYTKGFV